MVKFFYIITLHILKKTQVSYPRVLKRFRSKTLRFITPHRAVFTLIQNDNILYLPSHFINYLTWIRRSRVCLPICPLSTPFGRTLNNFVSQKYQTKPYKADNFTNYILNMQIFIEAQRRIKSFLTDYEKKVDTYIVLYLS